MKSHALGKYLGLFLFFILAEIILAWPSLHTSFFWDDLHLVRVYSPAELREVWTGTYDTDHVETAGLRPLMTVFNHVRAGLFGENALGHHLLLLVLFAAYLTLATALGRVLFQISYVLGGLAGLLTFLHLDNVTHYAWLTDGIHLVSGIFVFGAILFLLQALRSGRLWLMVASLACILAGLLTRDDVLVVVPLLALFAVALQRQGGDLPGARRPPLVLYSLGVIGVVAFYWLWRAAVVPQAGVGKVTPGNVIWGALQVIQNLGDINRLVVWWDSYILLMWLWALALGFVAVATVFFLPPGAGAGSLVGSSGADRCGAGCSSPAPTCCSSRSPSGACC